MLEEAPIQLHCLESVAKIVEIADAAICYISLGSSWGEFVRPGLWY